MVIFRENTEDIYAGLEVEAGHRRCPKDERSCCTTTSGGTSARAPGIGIKPVSEMGSKRLIRAAINYAKARNRK